MQSKTTSSIPSECHKINNVLSTFFADEYVNRYVVKPLSLLLFLKQKFKGY